MADKVAYKLPKVEELLESGVHFGHQAKKWHPRMSPYIYEKTKGVHIFDLYKSLEQLEKTAKFFYETASKGGKIIFVGTKKQAKELIQNEATRCGAMFITDRWVGGTLTNFQTIKKNINKLKDYMKKKENNELGHYTKKERLLIDREVEKLTQTYGGILTLTESPAAVFVVDIRREKTAVREALRQGIPVAALVDTNSDPTGLTYVIPGNDDALKAIAVITTTIANAIEAGYVEFAKKQKEAAEEVESLKEAEAAKAVLAEAVVVANEEAPKEVKKTEETEKKKKAKAKKSE